MNSNFATGIRNADFILVSGGRSVQHEPDEQSKEL